MSNILKGIGKVFKTIVKIQKFVLPIALAAGAVIFTGGAALGVLPTFAGAIGSVVGGLGLSTALTGALTGAVVSAGFGAAIGGATSALSGKNVMKGMQTGALTGAVTGGALGAMSPAAFGITKGVTGAGSMVSNAANAANAAGSSAASSTTGMGGGWLSGVGDTASSLGASAAGINVAGTPIVSGVQAAGSAAGSTIAATASPVAAAPAVAPAASGGGMLGFINQNPLLAGNLISGVAKGLGGGGGGGESAQDQYAARGEYERGMADYAYKGAYAGRADPFGVRDLAAPPEVSTNRYYTPPTRRWQFDPTTNKVVEVRT